ncbi:MAG TPA: hypothetical protein VFL86_16695, partial [Burkholderiaceae bacterium]|nr:hypothetical protein [Burkholderiaceae bacterium]
PASIDEIPDMPRARVLEKYLGAIALRTTQPVLADVAHLDTLTHEDLVDELHSLMTGLGILPKRAHRDVVHHSLVGFSRCVRIRYCAGRLYAGRVHLVQVPNARLEPLEDTQRRAQAVNQWRQAAPDLVAWQGPGNHMTVLNRPHVSVLAHWWKSHAARADAAAPPARRTAHT